MQPVIRALDVGSCPSHVMTVCKVLQDFVLTCAKEISMSCYCPPALAVTRPLVTLSRPCFEHVIR